MELKGYIWKIRRNFATFSILPGENCFIAQTTQNIPEKPDQKPNNRVAKTRKGVPQAKQLAYSTPEGGKGTMMLSGKRRK